MLAALALSLEHCSFVEIHWFDTGQFSQADSPSDHCGPLKAFSLPGEQSEDRCRAHQCVGFLCQGPGHVFPFPWQPASHPHLVIWTGIRYPSLRATLSPSSVCKGFPRSRTGVHCPSCQTAQAFPKWHCRAHCKGPHPSWASWLLGRKILLKAQLYKAFCNPPEPGGRYPKWIRLSILRLAPGWGSQWEKNNNAQNRKKEPQTPEPISILNLKQYLRVGFVKNK